MGRVVLEKGRERSLLRRHPWVFSGAVGAVHGSPGPGETVEVVAANGLVLGHGAFSPRSQIAVRMWTFDPEEAIDGEFLRRRLERALATREPVLAEEEPAGRRLVNAESDGLPGVVVDRYGPFLVCQLLSAGAERFREELLAALGELLSPAGIYERSDGEGREKEGLAPAAGLVAGEEPPERIEVREGPCRFLVDVRAGHKTGFYLDQRENRALVARHAAGARMLNAFAYTGGFGLAAQAAGAASVTHVESSAAFLDEIRANAEASGLDPSAAESVEGNVFSVLRGFRAEERRFDLVVLDPPKFADSRSRVEAAARGYKDINLLACQLLAPGGHLATFSCSGVLEAALFGKIVADAALDAGRDGRILRRFAQAPDHPVSLAFPEGRYLKGLLCRVW
ncbi:MAG TPA: class I SAM-dependent methyltransferase [Thermoanaerobaculia bacterium]|nr:class I SAM-dependent methyltransferase [Thermoanaerobaculia bacterium]